MPLIIKRARATIPHVQPEMKSRSSPGQFHHEPPLLVSTVRQNNDDVTNHNLCLVDYHLIAQADILVKN